MDWKAALIYSVAFLAAVGMVIKAFKKSIKVSGKAAADGFEGSIEATNPDPTTIAASTVPIDTILITMQPWDTRWSEGMNDGKECAIIVIHATVTNVYSKPVKLVKAILHPSGHEGGVGITRYNARDYQGVNAFLQHEAMPCSMIWTVPRAVCPASGDALQCGVTVIDQYGKRHTHMGVTVPHDGAPEIPR